MCGEHWSLQRQASSTQGSSPRVWGASRCLFFCAVHRRIIPTCVGSILPKLPTAWLQPDHPHVCGEHSGAVQTAGVQTGSSPRVWGALPKWSLRAPLIGIIPTCVGSIFNDSRAVFLTWDHPHVCGEHRNDVLVELDGHGSSPRVWGAFCCPCVCVCVLGIIPTCVGSIGGNVIFLLLISDHPHVCGEHCQNGACALRS